jgi:hypothetical protein
MMIELLQYPHFMVVAPAGGSSGAPQVGHMKRFVFSAMTNSLG